MAARQRQAFYSMVRKAKVRKAKVRKGRMFFFEKRTKKRLPGASHEAGSSRKNSRAAGIQTPEYLRR
jgi:hypothetical protein